MRASVASTLAGQRCEIREPTVRASVATTLAVQGCEIREPTCAPR
jgi:hypothetical protein